MMSKMLAGMAVGAVTAAMLLSGPAEASAQPNEDDPAWSCVYQGNRICGPQNHERKTPACYDDQGFIVALWPCHVIVNRDGSSDVYEGSAYSSALLIGGLS